MTMTAKDPILSSSVQVILEQLDELKISKTEFARQLGVSPDYVYRILKGRVPFPHVRETMERMAEICQLDPHVFAEYREMEQVLSASTRLVWQRMKEMNMSREDLFQAMGGRISRPYFNSILRGDQPFPSNRAYIQLFALALDLPPTVFKEFGRAQAPRWTDEQVVELEDAFFNLLFDKMLSDRDYARHHVQMALFGDVAATLFPKKGDLPAEVEDVLSRMGALGMGLGELEKVSGVPVDTLRKLFTGKLKPKTYTKELAEIRRALRVEKDATP